MHRPCNEISDSECAAYDESCSNCPATDSSSVVTPEMVKAGEQFASDAVDAQVAKCMNGLGGGKTAVEWLREDVPNKDLLIKYLDEEIPSVTGIYLAMRRAL